MTSAQHLAIRVATPDDARVLRQLAAFDSTAPLTGRVLLAELDEVPVAAVSLAAGAVAADPFRHTHAAVERLRPRLRPRPPERSDDRSGPD
jgi:hypothetical protein